jgi:fatty-acyl-CoA synthase
MDEEGYFYLVDRARDMYISGGENVYPAEVERVLRGHPDIDDVAVVGVPDEIWGETGHAFIILKPGSCLCTDDVAQFCDEKLARYKWPKKTTFCKDFPCTSLGKVRKVLLCRENA